VVAFLFTATTVSLSGVMAPGPMTAATFAAGTRSKHAGVLIALGHAVVEFPLMVLIIAGAGRLFQQEPVRIGIGFAGGAFLVFMGVQLLNALNSATDTATDTESRHPFVTGIVLTGANPYFLIWWATVGLVLATQAVELGPLAFVLFAVLHWLCDLIWLECLSFASFKGAECFGHRAQQCISLVCGIMLLGFGAKFVCDAGFSLFS
jgi:threonine/homoserine/homoserine lactone efflux protein